MNAVGDIAALRVSQALQGVGARIADIESRTGISFSSFMMRSQLMQSVSGRRDALGAEAPETETVDAVEYPDSSEIIDFTEFGTSPPPPFITSGVTDGFARLPESKYDDLFSEAAERYGLNAALIKAICFAESSFRQTAVSGAGAMGLMQLMPYTAEALGVDDPFDPAQSVDGGARLLSSLLDKFDGNALLAVAAYNCGAGRITSRGITGLETEAQRALLPAETRGYLDNIEQYLYASRASGVLGNPYMA